MNETLEIQLLGKDYRVACPPDEREALLAAVAFLDERLNSIQAKAPKSSGRASGERTAVMAALNIAHELLQLKTATPGSSMVPENTLESPAIARRIEAIERKLDASLAEYDAVP